MISVFSREESSIIFSKVFTGSGPAISDMLLMPAKDWHRSIRNVIKAVKSGEISRERLDESVRKVLKMKQQLGILEEKPFIDPKNIYEDTETKEVVDFIQQVCDASMTMVKRPSVALKGEGSLAELIKSGRLGNFC